MSVFIRNHRIGR